MTKPFYKRIDNYFSFAGEALRKQASAAAVMPNTSDIGLIRESIKKEFLEQHLPSGCNINLGGFLFNMEGEESGQLDIIVTTDSCPQYKLFKDKSFSCVDGTLAVISVKSTLDKQELDNALLNLASIPKANPLFAPEEDGKKIAQNFRVSYGSMEGYSTQNLWLLSGAKPRFYDNWPYKVVFAVNGIAPETLASHLDDFYNTHSEIPHERRVDMIYVSGKYYFRKKLQKAENGDSDFNGEGYKPDLFAPIKIIERIQDNYAASLFIQYRYSLLDQRLREDMIA